MIRIRVFSGGREEVFEFENGPITIGRSQQNSLSLADPNLSRAHCEIVREEGGWVLRDRGSRQGTYLNERRIEAAPVAAGDRIAIGDVRLEIEAMDPGEDRATELRRKLDEARKQKLRAASGGWRRTLRRAAVGFAVLGALCVAGYLGARSWMTGDAAPKNPPGEEPPSIVRENPGNPKPGGATPKEGNEPPKIDPFRDEALAAVRRGRYGEALAALKKYILQGGSHEEAADWVQEVDRNARMDFFGSVLPQIEEFRKAKAWEKLVRLCLEQAERFRGTDYRGDLLREADVARQTGGLEIAITPQPATNGSPGPALSAPQAALLKGIHAGQVKTILTESRTVLTVLGADERGIRTDIGFLTWEKLGPGPVFEALAGIASGGELLELAQAARAQKCDRPAELALYRYSLENPANLAAVQETLRVWRGLSSIPQGGFAWNEKLGRWESAAEKRRNERMASLLELTARSARATAPSEIEKAILETQRLVEDPQIEETVRAEMRKTAIEALQEGMAVRVGALRKRGLAPPPKLSQAAYELALKRRAVLELIFRNPAFVDEKNPAHPEVKKQASEAIEEVRELWKRGAGTAVPDAGAAAIVRCIQQIQAGLAAMGAPTERNFLGRDGEEFLANVTAKGPLTLRNYARTLKERDMLAWNDRVETYLGSYKNELPSTGAPPDTLKFLNLLNEYRQMLGRSRWFPSAPLQKAAQKHSQGLAKTGQLRHQGVDGSTVESRCDAAGFRPVDPSIKPGEIYCQASGPQAALDELIKIPEFQRLLLTEYYNCVGVGNTGKVWVLNMGKAKPPFDGSGE